MRPEAGFAERLVAGISTEEPAPRVRLGLVHRPERGELRTVTHLLASEKRVGESKDEHALRVRSDLLLAVVDRASS